MSIQKWSSNIAARVTAFDTALARHHYNQCYVESFTLRTIQDALLDMADADGTVPFAPQATKLAVALCAKLTHREATLRLIAPRSVVKNWVA